jgi:biopolymer transport protein ExbB
VTVARAPIARTIAADDKTPLPFHIDRQDWVNELAYIWVQLPKSGDPWFWLYFGNERATQAGDSILPPRSQSHGMRPGSATMQRNRPLPSCRGDRSMPPRIMTAASSPPCPRRLRHRARVAFAQASGFTFSAWIKSETSQNAVLFQQQVGTRSLTIALDNDQPVARVTGGDRKVI